MQLISFTIVMYMWFFFVACRQYHKASSLDHTWVAHRLLPELGLPQFSTSFEAQLVDGRLLNVLTKKDLEKYLCVQKKFHQSSVLYGVELLRRLKYDKEVCLCIFHQLWCRYPKAQRTMYDKYDYICIPFLPFYNSKHHSVE